MENPTLSIDPQEELKQFETKEIIKMKRFSAPVQPSPSRNEKVSPLGRRPMSSPFPSSAASTGPYRPQRRRNYSAAAMSVFRADSDPPKGSRTGSDSNRSSPTSHLVKESSAAGQYSSATTDASRTANAEQPLSRTLSWTKRVSRDFSSSTDLAAKLKSVCSMPGAVSKDASNVFANTSITCIKACADYWKPAKVTNEHRRVEAMNSRNSWIHARSTSTGSTWSSLSSRKSSTSSTKSSSSSRTSFDTDITMLDRDSIDGDRRIHGKEDPVVTIYGVNELGPPVVAKYHLDS